MGTPTTITRGLLVRVVRATPLRPSRRRLRRASRSLLRNPARRRRRLRHPRPRRHRLQVSREATLRMVITGTATLRMVIMEMVIMITPGLPTTVARTTEAQLARSPEVEISTQEFVPRELKATSRASTMYRCVAKNLG
jgi:hypothetical protein